MRLALALATVAMLACGGAEPPGGAGEPPPPADPAMALFVARDRAHADTLALVHRAPLIDGGAFDPVALLRASDALRALGKDTLLEVLRTYGEIVLSHPGLHGLDDQRIFLLLRLLCEPARPLHIGQPTVELPPGFTGWPQFPLVVQDGVPFLVVSGYTLGGKAERPHVHLDDCRDRGRLTTPAPPAPFAAAAEALVGSPAWREVMQSQADTAAAMIRAQARRAARGS